MLDSLFSESRPRQYGIWPYLLIRAFLGDYGKRWPPLNNFWESPDIIVVEGDVSTLEGNTPTLHPIPKTPHTIFVRVWNLGRLAAIGVRLRVYWANPSFSFDNPNSPGPQYIGGMYLDLSDRYQSGSHIVSRLPSLWSPTVVNGGHECLLAKVDSFADMTGSGFDANIDRHVGQRNLYLATPQEDLTSIIDSLGQTLPEGADVEMVLGIGGRFETKSISHAEVQGSLGKAVMQRLNIPDLKAKTVIGGFPHGGRADVEPLQFVAYQSKQDQDIKIFGGYTIYISNTESITRFYNRYTILPSYGTPTPPYNTTAPSNNDKKK